MKRRYGNSAAGLRRGFQLKSDLAGESSADDSDSYFDKAHNLFLTGHRLAARRLYEKLLSRFFRDEEYRYAPGRLITSAKSQRDLHRTCSRYFRALYDTAPLGQRAEALAQAMRAFGILCSRTPRFQDVIDAAEDPIGDLNEFVPSWIRTLTERCGKGHQWGWISIWDELLVEAATMWEGAEAAHKMAQENSPRRTLAYLMWVQALVKENRVAEALYAAQEALREVRSPTPTRAEIADVLSRLAAQSDDAALFRQSLHEAFRSDPVLDRLIRLYKVALAQGKAQEEMTWVAQQPLDMSDWFGDTLEREDYSQELIHLRARASLLAGELEQAIALAEQGYPLGWTFASNPQAVVIPFILLASAGMPSPAQAPFLFKVWVTYPSPDKAEDEFRALLLERLRDHLSTLQERQRHFSLIHPMIHARVCAIIEGRKSESYRKAAHLVLAEREVLLELGRSQEADEVVKEAFRRYQHATRFQTELSAAGVECNGPLS